ncbi:hypothetical protein KAU51_00090 [Candidatus Parcubacteria bacterium]|nr:hypothetical protein [Candidatus Parcubacteria bacterium]
MKNSFERPKIEYPEKGKEDQGYIEKLSNFLKEIAESLRTEKVPVDDDCRIDMDVFKDIYNVEKDKKSIQRAESKWLGYEDLNEEEKRAEKLKHTGEQLEMLVTAILGKFLGKDFIVVRSSRYDDIKNQIDNLILEKETGNVICAFDEVGESRGPRFEEKKEAILDKDREQGGVLKYGLKIEKGELKLDPQKNIPVFYLALKEGLIKKGVKEFIPSSEDKSDFEDKLFEHFKTSILSQISALLLELKLNPEIEKRISYFEEVLKK